MEKIFQDQAWKVFLGFFGKRCVGTFFVWRVLESFLIPEMLIFERFIKETKRRKKTDARISFLSFLVGKILVKIEFKVSLLIIATKRMIFNRGVWHSYH